MKAYLINLESAEDRLAHFDQQARTLGFNYQRVLAIDGRSPAYAESLKDVSAGPICGRVLAPVEVACFQSHRTAWRALVHSGDSHGVVLEDDVVLKPGFERYMAPGWVPHEADIVRLESWWKPLQLERAPASSAHGRDIYLLRSGTVGAAAYALSATCAEALLERTDEQPADPVDEVLFNVASPLFKRLKTYQMMPAPARQAHLLASYQEQNFAKSALASVRGQSEWQKHLSNRRSWWRPFPDMPDPTLTDIRNMVVWTTKQRLKSTIYGTRFTAVPFE